MRLPSLVAAGRRRYGWPDSCGGVGGMSGAVWKVFRHAPAAAVALGIAGLSGCGPAPQSRLPTGTLVGPPPRFTLDTPVERIAADPAGDAVLHRDLPGLMSSSSYIMIEDMSLSQIASISSGRITRAKLNVLEADLAALSPRNP